ncbi:hypothetical protein [Agrobacterium sp. LAD9]|uniref:hypothetical protein n=1 Tax=Agrobacterium sp. LAD9 TaxID=2055153 RepID=UPI001290443A|nr:hypothetical protein [Agrobacterium sp. LAD9]
MGGAKVLPVTDDGSVGENISLGGQSVIEYQGISSKRTIFFGRLVICLFVFLLLLLPALLNKIHFFQRNKNGDRLV